MVFMPEGVPPDERDSGPKPRTYGRIKVPQDKPNDQPISAGDRWFDEGGKAQRAFLIYFVLAAGLAWGCTDAWPDAEISLGHQPPVQLSLQFCSGRCAQFPLGWL